MKFYLAIVQNETISALYTYDTLDAALAAYHAELAYRSEARTSTRCAIMNQDLEVVMRESYFMASSQDEPEETNDLEQTGNNNDWE